MDLARNYQVCALLRVEALKIRNMLEVIGVDLSAVYYLIGLYVVLEDFDLQFIAFLCQNRLCSFQDLRMRCRTCRNGDLLALLRAFSRSLRLITGR